MLPAEHRLRRREDFAAALRQGRRCGRPAVVVHLQCNDRNDPADALVRVGLVVSRGVGGAVVRNQVKRRLREIMRTRLAGLPAGSVVVLRALPAAAHASAAQLCAQVDAGLARLLPVEV